MIKNDIRTRSDEFLSAIKPKVIVNGSTSGTTGTPLSIPQSMDSVVREQAFITRALGWGGVFVRFYCGDIQTN